MNFVLCMVGVALVFSGSGIFCCGYESFVKGSKAEVGRCCGFSDMTMILLFIC